MSRTGVNRLITAAGASVCIHALVGVAVWYAPPVESGDGPGVVSALSVVPMTLDGPRAEPPKPHPPESAPREAPPPPKEASDPPRLRPEPVSPPEPPKIAIGDGDPGTKSRSPLGSPLGGEHVTRPSDQDQPALAIHGGPRQPAMPAVQPSPEPSPPREERPAQAQDREQPEDASMSGPPPDPDGSRTPPEVVPGPSAGPTPNEGPASPTPKPVEQDRTPRDTEEERPPIAAKEAADRTVRPELPLPIGPEREAQPAQAPPATGPGAGREEVKPAEREGPNRDEVIASQPTQSAPPERPRPPVKLDPSLAPGASTLTPGPVSLDSPAVRLALNLAGIPIGPPRPETGAAAEARHAAGSRPAPPATRASPPTPAMAGVPGVQSNKDSDAFSVKVTGEYRNGRIIGAEGLEIRPVHPQLSLVTKSLTGARRVVVEVQFLKEGTVKSARIVETSGLISEIDEPVLNAVYAWTASGSALRELPDRPGAYVLLTIAITVR